MGQACVAGRYASGGLHKRGCQKPGARAFVVGVLTLNLASVSWPSTASAQESNTAPSTTTPSQPLDVVQLKNGGMLRGTIAELVPEQYVIIETTAGEQRRIDMKDVKYAGPAKDAPSVSATTSDAPPTPPAAPPTAPPAATLPVPPGVVDVHFAGEPGVRFHIRTHQAVLRNTRLTADSFEEICTAPCSARLQRQSYTFGLSEGDGRPALVENAIPLDGPTTLTGKYTSYTGLRVAGYIVMIGGVLAGTAIMLSAPNECDVLDDTCEPVDSTMLWGGVAVAGAGTLIGLIMILKKDEAEVSAASAQQVGQRRPTIAAHRHGGAARGRFVVPVFSARF